MKKFLLYAAAVLGNVLLINWSELWYGAEWFTEWLFGLLTVVLFAFFLQGWKRYSQNGVGLILITGFGLLTINSIFFVQNLPASICSSLLGLLLIPLYTDHRDAVITAWGFVLINIIINIEVQSGITLVLLSLTTGIGAIVGFRFKFLLLKRCFTVLFSLTFLTLLFAFLLF
ncbi:hypothetical protein [Lederbergia lenta]|uniref:Uncharacterized protein n=1 Tax=Lederbergia lenta TaxID=1467 RepID=A0A2X4VQ27_LEDLE|nr:hypothetical protein [Lederbergia lenta]MEC2326622.1 hypothetical protein [Lederbergia lenta]SQI53011.1 Uncharacterised protein [Lederbergia lenta]